MHSYSTLAVWRNELAAAGEDRIIRVWSFSADNRIRAPIELRGPEQKISAMAFSPDGTYLASADFGGSVLVQLARPSRAVHLPPRSTTSQMEDVDLVSHDGTLVTRFERPLHRLKIQRAGDDHTLAEIPADRKPVLVLFSVKGHFAAVAFSNLVITRAREQRNAADLASVTLLDLSSSQPAAEFRTRNIATRATMSFAADESAFALATERRGILLWNANSHTTSSIPTRDPAKTVRLSPSGRLLAWSSATGTTIVDTRTTKLLFQSESPARDVYFTSDEHLSCIFAADRGHESVIVDLVHGARLPVPLGNELLTGVAFAPDSRRVYIRRGGVLEVYSASPWMLLVSIPLAKPSDSTPNGIESDVTALQHQFSAGFP